MKIIKDFCSCIPLKCGVKLPVLQGLLGGFECLQRGNRENSEACVVICSCKVTRRCVSFTFTQWVQR